jgi:helicase required for RNAi-mediated heterochromatin assembly 1
MGTISAREEGDANRILQRHIHKTYEDAAFAEEWRNLPEIPSSAEILPPSKDGLETEDETFKQNEGWNDYQKEPVYDPNLPRNIVDGPWPSKEAYIGAHYQILREDAIAPLRQAVADVKRNPAMYDNVDICVYTHVSGLTKGDVVYDLANHHRSHSRDFSLAAPVLLFA